MVIIYRLCLFACTSIIITTAFSAISRISSQSISESYDLVQELFGDLNDDGLMEKERYHLEKYGHLSPQGFLAYFRSKIKGERVDSTHDIMSVEGSFTSHELNQTVYFKPSQYLNWEIYDISHGMKFICENWNGIICHERSDNELDSTCWCVDEYELREYSWSPSSDSTNETCIEMCATNELDKIYAKNQAPYDAITKLNLEHLQLVGGMIPEDINSLRFLEVLHLNGNHLVGELPSTIGDLEGLVTLDLAGCHIFQIPEEIRYLRNLDYLDVNSCDLRHISSSLGSLLNLRVFAASDNHFSDWSNIPDFIFNFTNLEYLDLSENNLVGFLSKDFSKLIKLDTLDLEKNNFEGTLPVDISKLPHLKTLKLNGNSLNGSLPMEWTSSIEKIELGANQFTGTIPSTIFQPSLAELLLYRNEFTGTIPMEIKNSVLLSSLEIDDNALIGTLPVDIHEFPHLVNLEFHGNFFEGELDESMCYKLDLTGRTSYPFEYVFFSCTHFIACPKGLVSKLGYATDFDTCVPCPSCDDSSNTKNIFCAFLGQPSDRCNDEHEFKESSLELSNPNSMTSAHQRELLRSIFVEMQGYSWNSTFQVWGDMRYSDPCTLPGIVCSDGLVASIDLRNAGFCSTVNKHSCKIPGQIGLFGDSLKELELSDISVSNRRLILPTTIKFLRNLEKLSLSNNLIDNIPKELLECKKFKYLFMRDCGPISDFENAVFWDIASLKVLDLEGARVESQNIPTRIGSMRELEYLKMNYAGIGGPIPSEIGNLSKLVMLDLHNNNLTGEIPASFSNFQMMDKLDLYNNNLGGTINVITSLKNLEVLNLNSNNFDGAIPFDIDKLEKLFWIDLGLNNMTGVIPSSFTKMIMLRHLRLGGNKFQPFIAEPLCQLAVNEGPYENGSCNHFLCPLDTFSKEGFASKDMACSRCPDGSITKTVGSVDISSCFTLSEYDHFYALQKAISGEEGHNADKDHCAMKGLEVNCDSNGHVSSFSIPLSNISFDEAFINSA